MIYIYILDWTKFIIVMDNDNGMTSAIDFCYNNIRDW